ncbi:MAG: hypothetical protein V9F82_13995 [Dermatophilaceae bacterium]
MSPRTAAATVVRQRGSVALGVCAILTCVVVLLGSLEGLSLGVAAALGLTASASFVLLVRPSVALGVDGVALNNPLRRVLVPWPRVQGCRDRWNLQIDVGERLITAWAISAHRARPVGVGPMRGGGVLRGFPELEGPPAERTTAGSVARQVRAGHAEWAALVAAGELTPDADQPVSARWDLLDAVLLGVPAAMAVVALVW